MVARQVEVSNRLRHHCLRNVALAQMSCEEEPAGHSKETDAARGEQLDNRDSVWAGSHKLFG